MDDEGGLSLTPSNALHTEVAKRVLEIWDRMEKGGADVGELRAAVVDLKSSGAECLGDQGVDLLGPALVASPALLNELSAADRAYDLARDAAVQGQNKASSEKAIDALVHREGSNPYVGVALQELTERVPFLEPNVAASKARRAESGEAEDMLIPAERNHKSLGASQVRAALLSKDRVQEERATVVKALTALYVTPKNAQARIEASVLAGQVNADTLSREIHATPERFGEVRSFKTRFWKREGQDARHLAVASTARASRDLAGTVGYFIGEIRNSELDIAEQQAAGIPAPSKELGEILEQTPSGGDLFAGISQEHRRDRLVSEAQTLVRQITQRGLSKHDMGLASQLASRLRNVQARLKSAVTLDRSRTQELEQRQEDQTLSQ